MHHRAGCWLTKAVLLLAGVGAAAEGTQRRPNVILLMPDQMRSQAMGVAGDEQIHTPNLDRLAREGLYLPNTFANNPVCCPARATILTGVYPHTHGVLVNDLRLREDRVTLAERLAEAGYATGFVGKWHLDGGRRMPGFVPPGPRRQGFEFWAANECNHDHFDSIFFRDTDTPIAIKTFEPEVWMDEAIRFIRQHRDQPFFLWWACGPPHNPYAAPPRFEQLYDAAKLTMRPNWKEGAKSGSRQDVARYYAAITAIDEQVGRLMRLLDELELSDDTIVLFTSDHGDMLGSHGLPLKCKPWEESIRVPGIIRYPRRIAPGQRRDTLFSHVDLLPTLLSLCGVPVPKDAQGRDLSKHFVQDPPTTSHSSEPLVEPPAVFFQIYEPRPQEGLPGGWRGVRTARFMYARLQDRPWVLYDLSADPYQLTNLVSDPEHERTRAELDALIAEEMRRTSDSWANDLSEPLPLHMGPAVYHPSQAHLPEK